MLGVTQATASVFAGWLAARLPAVLPFLGLRSGRGSRSSSALAITRLACLGFFLAAVHEPRSKPIRTFVIAAAQSYVKARIETLKMMAQDD